MCRKIFFSFLNIFQKRKTELQEWRTDIVTIEDLNSLNREKIDFIYDNAINYMKEIKFGFDKINQKTTLLLSYLSIIIAFLVNKILDNQLIIEYKIFALSVIAIYFCIIIYIVDRLLSPKLSEAIYNEPKSFLMKDCVNFQFENIKFAEIQNMQNRINKLLIEQDIIVSYLQNSCSIPLSHLHSQCQH